jgi:F420-0:gamma-glutamyl ligase
MLATVCLEPGAVCTLTVMAAGRRGTRTRADLRGRSSLARFAVATADAVVAAATLVQGEQVES